MKNYLVLVIGLPGVGKSTVSEIIAKEIGGVILNSDVLRQELFPEKRTYDSKETSTVIAETEKRCKELLQKGKNVTLDALFTKKNSREKYKGLAERLGANFLVIEVTADEPKIKERMDKRKLENNASEADFSYYLDRKSHFESELGALSIDNSGPREELVGKLKGIILGIKDHKL